VVQVNVTFVLHYFQTSLHDKPNSYTKLHLILVPVSDLFIDGVSNSGYMVSNDRVIHEFERT
jgi:hypothetical protein